MTYNMTPAVERPEGEPPVLTAEPDWKVAFGRAKAKFSQDQCTDLAAALTYYSVQAMFPALIAGVSLLGLFGNGKETTKQVVNVIAGIAGKDSKDLGSVTSFIDNLQTSGGAGLAFALSILMALWSASGYVGAFSRMQNRIYDVAEGRSALKLRPWLYLVTIVQVVLLVIAAMALVLSGPVAKQIGSVIGLGEQTVQIWDIVKWPFIVVIVMFIIGMMFWATPNIKRPLKQGIFNPGAILAFVIWALGSAAFAWYVSNMGNYGKTYGPMATPIILLLWLWITNLAMLFGAEFDAEVLRTRQLKSGYPAEELVLLPVRDDAGIVKKQEKYEEQLDKAHELRVASGIHDDEIADMLPIDPRQRSRERTAAAQESSPEARPVTPSTKTVEGQPELAAAHTVTAPKLSRGGSHDANEATLDNSLTPAERAFAQQRAEERAEISSARHDRRREALAVSRERRKKRDAREAEEARLVAEQKKADAERRKAEAEQEAQRPLQEKWAEVDANRARFDHPDTREFRAVTAEREARRAEWNKRK